MTREQLLECYKNLYTLGDRLDEDHKAGIKSEAFVYVNVMGIEYKVPFDNFAETEWDVERGEQILWLDLNPNTYKLDKDKVDIDADEDVDIDIDKICAIRRAYKVFEEEQKKSEPTKIIATITPTDGRRISQTDYVKLRKFGEYDEEKYRNSGCEKLEFSFLTIELFNVWFERVKGLKFNKKYCLVLVDNRKQVEYIFGGKDGK